jgi:hypothetical protein
MTRSILASHINTNVAFTAPDLGKLASHSAQWEARGSDVLGFVLWCSDHDESFAIRLIDSHAKIISAIQTKESQQNWLGVLARVAVKCQNVGAIRALLERKPAYSRDFSQLFAHTLKHTFRGKEA